MQTILTRLLNSMVLFPRTNRVTLRHPCNIPLFLLCSTLFYRLTPAFLYLLPSSIYRFTPRRQCKHVRSTLEASAAWLMQWLVKRESRARRGTQMAGKCRTPFQLTSTRTRQEQHGHTSLLLSQGRSGCHEEDGTYAHDVTAPSSDSRR